MDSTLVALARDIGTQVGDIGIASIEALQEAAPVVWAVVRQRVIASNSVGLGFCTIAVIMSIALGFFARYTNKQQEWDSDVRDVIIGVSIGIIIIVCIVTLVIVPLCLIELLSIDYTTAVKMMELIK